jgi:hypothetical protein
LVVESKYIELLKALQSSKTSAQLFLNSSSFENGLKQATENGLSGISIYFDRIKAAQIGIAKEQGLLISVFGVNTWSKNKESILMSADYIQSDRIRHLVKIMEDLYE